MRKNSLLLFTALLAAASCTLEKGTDTASGSRQLTFTAAWEDSQDSKTAIQSDGVSVWWTTAEKINAFYGSMYSGVFTSTNTAPARTVQFTGNLNVLAGSVESDSGQSRYWAVYPYSASNTCDGESVTLNLPDVQPSVAGSVADKFFPAVATSSSLELAFYNVCGGARFSVSNEGIEQVAFTALGGESLAGSVRVGFDNAGHPAIKKVLNGVSEVVVNAPSGGFIPGKYYFAALLPGTLSGGLRITYIKSGSKSASTTIEKAITVKRSVFGKLDNLDAGLVFSSANLIQFADAQVKQICVGNWDTDGDGELSYEEAAAVTSVGTVFRRSNITSFDEFQYFTGVTALETYAFNFCQSLKSIKLPSGLTSIDSYALGYCSSLESIHIPESVTSIGVGPLAHCIALKQITGKYSACEGRALIVGTVMKAFAPYGLTSWTVPSGITEIDDFTFASCDSLNSVVLPSSLTRIGFGGFVGCSSITTISLPSGLKTLGPYAFSTCTSLKSLHIPASVTHISYGVCSRCPNLTGFSGRYASSDGRALVFNNTLVAIAPYGMTEWAVPSGVTIIESNTFDDCYYVTSIELPSGLISIESSAFIRCRSLASITIPASLESLYSSAFSGCSSLSSIECLAANPPKGGSNMFYGTSCPIYVPESSVDKYKAAAYWSDYKDRITARKVCEYVDMGLSVKWAEHNLGATKPSDRGGYYAWAELEPRTRFTIKGYKYSDDQGRYTKYFADPASSGQGSFEIEDDAANYQWGNGWRVPTADECEELFDSKNCSVEHVTRDGILGVELTSKKTGNKLFLPAGGRRYDESDVILTEGKYWTSTVDYGYNGVFALLFYEVGDLSVSFVSRYQGLLIRPVHD